MPDQRNTITGRSAFLSVLKAEGVTHMFGNPGTTELPIMHALTAEPDLTYVLGLQESIVIFLADGYARASGELVACNVHVAPGLGNAMGAIFTAMNGGTPMIVTAGQQEQGHGLMEPLLYGPLVDMAKPNVKWSVEVTQLEDLPRILHRAAKIALTAPTGPVFISLPGDILNADAAIDMGKVTRVDTATRPTDAALAAFADRLIAAERPVIVAGTEVVNADAFELAGEFASALGAAVYQQTVPSGAHFPSEHPAYIGGLGRSQPQVRKVMSDYDLMVCLGADVLRMSVYDPVEPLPEAHQRRLADDRDDVARAQVPDAAHLRRSGALARARGLAHGGQEGGRARGPLPRTRNMRPAVPIVAARPQPGVHVVPRAARGRRSEKVRI